MSYIAPYHLYILQESGILFSPQSPHLYNGYNHSDL